MGAEPCGPSRGCGGCGGGSSCCTACCRCHCRRCRCCASSSCTFCCSCCSSSCTAAPCSRLGPDRHACICAATSASLCCRRPGVPRIWLHRSCRPASSPSTSSSSCCCCCCRNCSSCCCRSSCGGGSCGCRQACARSSASLLVTWSMLWVFCRIGCCGRSRADEGAGRGGCGGTGSCVAGNGTRLGAGGGAGGGAEGGCTGHSLPPGTMRTWLRCVVPCLGSGPIVRCTRRSARPPPTAKGARAAGCTCTGGGCGDPALVGAGAGPCGGCGCRSGAPRPPACPPRMYTSRSSALVRRLGGHGGAAAVTAAARAGGVQPDKEGLCGGTNCMLAARGGGGSGGAALPGCKGALLAAGARAPDAPNTAGPLFLPSASSSSSAVKSMTSSTCLAEAWLRNGGARG